MSDKDLNVFLKEGQEAIVIREGRANDIFEYAGYSYSLDSIKSLVTMVNAKANKPQCVIAYNDCGVDVILDDTVLDRTQDRLSHRFTYSQQAKEWLEILKNGKVFGQKKLLDFLKNREIGEIADIEMFMASVQNFRYVTNIVGDFIHDDNNNYTFAIKVGEAEGTVRIPQIIGANIEILNDSGFIQPIEIEIDINKPKEQGEAPLFALSCPKFDRYYKEAVKEQIEQLEKGLPDYLIVAGKI